MPNVGNRAIVIGASIGGLLAARVLSDYCGEVVVLERDVMLAAGGHRKGVPQARHTHALLSRGREVLETLFPGLTTELVAAGAVLGDPLAEVRRYMAGGYYCQCPSGRRGLMLSRPMLEDYVRSRVLQRQNVRAVEGVDVLGPVATDDRSRVTGVRVLRRPASLETGTAPATPEIWTADLVVDASGRGSRASGWLAELGYAAPEEDGGRRDGLRDSPIPSHAATPRRREDAHGGGDPGLPPRRDCDRSGG